MKETFSTTTSLGFSLKHVFTHLFTFSGRAQRGEYWIWMLYEIYFSFVLPEIIGFETWLKIALCMLPFIIVGHLALSSRRGHDIGYSTITSILIGIIPVLSLILAFTPSNPDPNKYGEIQ